MPEEYFFKFLDLINEFANLLNNTKLKLKDQDKYYQLKREIKIRFCLVGYKFRKYALKEDPNDLDNNKNYRYTELAKNKHYIEKFEISFNI
jgi:hypothetical protein